MGYICGLPPEQVRGQTVLLIKIILQPERKGQPNACLLAVAAERLLYSGITGGRLSNILDIE